MTGLRWIVFELILAMLRNFHLGNPRGMCDSILNEEKSIPHSCGLRAADDSEEHMWHHTLFWLCDLYTSPYPAWLVSFLILSVLHSASIGGVPGHLNDRLMTDWSLGPSRIHFPPDPPPRNLPNLEGNVHIEAHPIIRRISSRSF